MLRFAFAVGTILVAVAGGACSLDRGGLSPVDTGIGEDDAAGTDGQGQLGCGPCGPCQRCGIDGSCEIDPASHWEIVCVSAGIAASPPGRDKWDPDATTSAGGAPDPYCQFDLMAGGDGGAANTGTTTTIPDTFTPNWNQVITPPGQTISAADLLDPHATWKLTVGDDDGCAEIGVCLAETICTLSPPMNVSWLNDGLVAAPVAPSCQTLSLRLVCQP